MVCVSKIIKLDDFPAKFVKLGDFLGDGHVFA